ncbi:MAG: type II toxin-antitoxin system prevent-host-death family antitoxin [Burkholderiales bacterium]|nr:type II toxin-antitoxin system prevent-host-death family antitoxin [Opitutaceae bacterium]
MKTSTIRELKHATSRVLGWAEAGEAVEVRRRGKPVVVITAPAKATRVARPDFEGRLRAIYGDTVLAVSASELIGEARGER